MIQDVRFRVPCGANGDGEHSKRDHSMHGLCPRGQLGGVTDPSGNGSHVQVALLSHFYNPKDSLESLLGCLRASWYMEQSESNDEMRWCQLINKC